MPRTSKNTQSKSDQLKAAQDAKSEKQIIAESDTAWENLWSDFNECKAYTKQLECKLSDKVAECEKLHSDLQNSQQKLQQLKADFDSLQQKYNERYQELRLEHQTAKRRQRLSGLKSRWRFWRRQKLKQTESFLNMPVTQRLLWTIWKPLIAVMSLPNGSPCNFANPMSNAQSYHWGG